MLPRVFFLSSAHRLTRFRSSVLQGFFPTVWGWIKRWFRPRHHLEDLHSVRRRGAAHSDPPFMEPSSIPKQYGGELEWQWGDMPNLDEPAKEKLQGIEQTS